jgi:redox-sensitive bicupin YhaK (pirin superfamily)
MSNISQIIEERPHHIGNFLVGRLLPFISRRTVGPFIFIDHMGPVEMAANENFDVPPHPHIGLSTLTYLFEGSVMHRDSLGMVVEIKPGEVNWMTAGRGIVHSERTPDYLRTVSKRMHGLQLWVAMPKALEQSEPSFAHVEANDIPQWQTDGLHYKLIAGEAFGHRSPVPVWSKLFMVELKASKTVEVNIGEDLFGEAAMYILEGEVQSEGHQYGPKQLLVSTEPALCRFTLSAGSTIYILGGEPFPEERFIYWNFVATSRELIEEAKTRWQAQTFPAIPGETGFVPLPVTKR